VSFDNPLLFVFGTGKFYFEARSFTMVKTKILIFCITKLVSQKWLEYNTMPKMVSAGSSETQYPSTRLYTQKTTYFF